MLKNAYLDAKIGFDTAENELSKVRGFLTGVGGGHDPSSLLGFKGSWKLAARKSGKRATRSHEVRQLLAGMTVWLRDERSSLQEKHRSVAACSPEISVL